MFVPQKLPCASLLFYLSGRVAEAPMQNYLMASRTRLSRVALNGESGLSSRLTSHLIIAQRSCYSTEQITHFSKSKYWDYRILTSSITDIGDRYLSFQGCCRSRNIPFLLIIMIAQAISFGRVKKGLGTRL